MVKGTYSTTGIPLNIKLRFKYVKMNAWISSNINLYERPSHLKKIKFN